VTEEKEIDLSAVELEQEIHGQSIDWYLQKLVHLANVNGWEFGLTLVLGGSVVSGIVISGKKYFDTFADEISQAWPGDDKEELRSAFASHGEIYDLPEGEEPRPPQYIHLKDARISYPNGNIPSSGTVLWRGKINAVSGFNLGMLSRSDA
jgi:hypothetical protein